ncbi:MAG: thermonuclease family protein [Rhodospirillales bacterium]|nr:thermonuclease family protein [Rhodospirillales bacterium]
MTIAVIKRRWVGPFLLFLFSMAVGAEPVSAQAVSGLPFVSDGDTLGFGERRVRLFGVDAPEADQSCQIMGQEAPIGEWATKTLRRLIGRDSVTCYPIGRPKGVHMVARCHTKTVPDIGRSMIDSGFAWDFKRISHGIYSDNEAEARKRGLGIWAGRVACLPPWEWRRH